jgi:3-hydroxyisobutyrate dehydrogenase-like beta-hydroxyacid dehydrogenase
MGASFRIVHKDLSLVRKLGARAKLSLPINNCTYQYWKYAVDTGRGEQDLARAVLLMKKVLAKKAHQRYA